MQVPPATCWLCDLGHVPSLSEPPFLHLGRGEHTSSRTAGRTSGRVWSRPAAALPPPGRATAPEPGCPGWARLPAAPDHVCGHGHPTPSGQDLSHSGRPSASLVSWRLVPGLCPPVCEGTRHQPSAELPAPGPFCSRSLTGSAAGMTQQGRVQIPAPPLRSPPPSGPSCHSQRLPASVSPPVNVGNNFSHSVGCREACMSPDSWHWLHRCGSNV